MMVIEGIKYACSTCVRGHRTNTCNHSNRPLEVLKGSNRTKAVKDSRIRRPSQEERLGKLWDRLHQHPGSISGSSSPAQSPYASSEANSIMDAPMAGHSRPGDDVFASSFVADGRAPQDHMAVDPAASFFPMADLYQEVEREYVTAESTEVSTPTSHMHSQSPLSASPVAVEHPKWHEQLPETQIVTDGQMNGWSPNNAAMKTGDITPSAESPEAESPEETRPDEIRSRERKRVIEKCPLLGCKVKPLNLRLHIATHFLVFCEICKAYKPKGHIKKTHEELKGRRDGQGKCAGCYLTVSTKHYLEHCRTCPFPVLKPERGTTTFQELVGLIFGQNSTVPPNEMPGILNGIDVPHQHPLGQQLWEGVEAAPGAGPVFQAQVTEHLYGGALAEAHSAHAPAMPVIGPIGGGGLPLSPEHAALGHAVAAPSISVPTMPVLAMPVQQPMPVHTMPVATIPVPPVPAVESPGCFELSSPVYFHTSEPLDGAAHTFAQLRMQETSPTQPEQHMSYSQVHPQILVSHPAPDMQRMEAHPSHGFPAYQHAEALVHPQPMRFPGPQIDERNHYIPCPTMTNYGRVAC